ncbi:MAG: hypothetical protein HRU18_00920 [Pseudoalteromonas sp.]|uniref:hypothetical protein n=1 Tax=Pseudoalteromonas sp. TaxID=53249 RepID=UPI001DD8AACC|nr:hypothetical protein [Pseudoalteromonas sp.]NRA76742.1 hypothetical protein [Pseudoalteromonas sp.]
MSGIATAVIAGAVISGAVASKNAKKAAKASAEGIDTATGEQRRQFDITQESLQPFQEAGVAALGQQQALLGLSGQEEQTEAFSALEESPGQRFLRDRAQKNLLRNSSAIGGLGGGNVRSALVQQGVGFAQQDLQNQFARLGQVAGQGQAATTAVGQFGQSSSANISNLAVQGGNARATGIQNQSAIQQQAIGQIAGAAGQFIGRPSTPPPSSTANIGIT